MSQEESVLDRRMGFCDSLSAYDTDELYTTCDGCDQFHCLCCCHDPSDDTVCHHYPVVFTDGACSRNGFDGAVSGIGGTYGNDVAYQWSIPVDERIDSTPIRTNQRAELLAAIEGVRRLGDFLESKAEDNPPLNPRSVMVVATDSEYVCKGVTEWMPKWKVCVAIILVVTCWL
jgi:ribonuclease HI